MIPKLPFAVTFVFVEDTVNCLLYIFLGNLRILYDIATFFLFQVKEDKYNFLCWCFYHVICIMSKKTNGLYLLRYCWWVRLDILKKLCNGLKPGWLELKWTKCTWYNPYIFLKNKKNIKEQILPALLRTLLFDSWEAWCNNESLLQLRSWSIISL